MTVALWAGVLGAAGSSLPQTVPPASGWRREIPTDEMASGVPRKGYVNWFTLRAPMCSFLGGITFGHRHPKDLWIFHEGPFRFYTAGMDDTLEAEGPVFGLRAFYSRPREPFRSFWGHLMGWTLGEHHPSYILVNGRRVWDARLHRIDTRQERHTLAFPCWVDEPDDLTIDFVVDRRHAPGTRALAFRYGYLEYLGDPGERYHLQGARTQKEPSPFDRLNPFRFGLFGPGYHPSAQWWSDPDLARRAMTVERLGWRPYVPPDHPVDEIALAPTSLNRWPVPFVDFVTRYTGATLLGPEADESAIQRLGPRFLGFRMNGAPLEETRRLLQKHPRARIYWWFEQDRVPDLERLRQEAGRPDRITAVFELFPPSLAAAARAFENGADLLQLKNQELPQINILVAMARGAGRSFGRPWGAGCYTIKTPFPSVDFLEQQYLLWYFSGIRYLDSEEIETGTFPRILDQDLAFYRALRFCGLHPSRGQPVVRIGVLYSRDAPDWVIPYTPFGAKDTFRRYIEYDHRLRRLTCRPVAELELTPGLWDRPAWLRALARAEQASAAANRGYDLLDVFFPGFGDAHTARFARMLTGTPYGPVDFLCAERVPPEILREYRLLAVLAPHPLGAAVETRLKQVEEMGTRLVRPGQATRPLLHRLGGEAAMVSFRPADDRIEYVVNRKGEGLLLAVFNHGAIPVGSDRVFEQRVSPPEPLVSEVKGPWEGEMTIHLERAGLPPGRDYTLLEVQGLDGEPYARVLSGEEPFRLREAACTAVPHGLQAKVRIGRRAEFVIAPRGRAEQVFFGR